MKKQDYELCSYRTDDEKWIPKAKVFIEKQGKKETVVIESQGFFDYEEEKEANNHAMYLVKDYFARHG
ncbi:MAG: hypothetical protein K8T10_06130 [Candidatus Eremiobacteraeota bacterium]|nr:hypothetical protein [Candidatus Eremiobacteraeota bacterium]